MMMIVTLACDGKSPRPWFREPWPWLLMLGPFIVIIAGLYTAWLAVSSSDGLVAEDYYKQGLAAGETLSRSRHADDLGLTAGLRLTETTVQVRLSARRADMPMPSTLWVVLSHPTRAGLDRRSQLKRGGAGRDDLYLGTLRLPASGHWLVLVEDEAKTWRLLGSVMLPAANETVIGLNGVADKPAS